MKVAAKKYIREVWSGDVHDPTITINEIFIPALKLAFTSDGRQMNVYYAEKANNQLGVVGPGAYIEYYPAFLEEAKTNERYAEMLRKNEEKKAKIVETETTDIELDLEFVIDLKKIADYQVTIKDLKKKNKTAAKNYLA